MPHPNDQYDPVPDDAPAVPAAWSAPSVTSTAIAAECVCPIDCPRDHENE